MKAGLSAFLFCTATFLIHAESPPSEKEDISPQAIRPCARCVEARENNLKHPNEYFYYEEYLEAKEKKSPQ